MLTEEQNNQFRLMLEDTEEKLKHQITFNALCRIITGGFSGQDGIEEDLKAATSDASEQIFLVNQELEKLRAILIECIKIHKSIYGNLGAK